MIQLAQVVVVLLHTPDGHEVLLNPKQVTAMHSSVPGKPNEVMTDEVRCRISTTDGKFLAVIETCDIVRRIMGSSAPKEMKK